MWRTCNFSDKIRTAVPMSREMIVTYEYKGNIYIWFKSRIEVVKGKTEKRHTDIYASQT